MGVCKIGKPVVRGCCNLLWGRLPGCLPILPLLPRPVAAHCLRAKLRRPRHALQAAASLFVCEVAADCHSALGELDAAVSDSERCVLHLDGRHLGDDRGALQVCGGAM